MRNDVEGTDPVGRAGLRPRLGAIAIAMAMLVGIAIAVPAGAMTNPDGTTLTPAGPVFTTYGFSARTSTKPFVVSGYPSGTILQATVIMFGAGEGTTFRVTPVGSASLAYGYAAWSDLTSLSFTASMEDMNATLASLAVNGGSAPSKAPIRIMVTQDTGVAYNALNGHFYKFVAKPVNGTALDWDQARAAAESLSFGGVNGYLTTIESEQENTFVASKVGGATNAWIGANDVDVLGQFKWQTGPDAGTVFWQAQCVTTNSCGQNFDPTNPAINTYSSWADGEPNNWGQSPSDTPEKCVVINRKNAGSTQVAFKKWNDLPCNLTRGIDGFVVEFAGAEGLWSGVLYESTAVSVTAPAVVSPIVIAFNFFKGAIYKATRNVAAALKLKIGTKWRAILRSDPVEIGSGTIESEDDVVSVEMPLDLEPGDHSVTFEGTDPSGARSSAVATFTLDASGVITAVDYDTTAAPRYAG